MSQYIDRPDDLKQDAKSFLKSEYGQYIVSILEEMAQGYLTSAADVKVEHPERYAAKYSAIQEVLNLLHAPLDEHTPSQS